MLHFTCDYTLRIIVSLDKGSTNFAIKSLSPSLMTKKKEKKSYLLLHDYDIKNGLTVNFIMLSRNMLYLVL